MKYLDYSRLQTCYDHALRTFLLSIHETDTVRRTQTAFAEYFTSEPNGENVYVSDIRIRMRAIGENVDYDYNHFDKFQIAFDWLGITVNVFEYRSDGQKQRDYELLPGDFKLERGEEYDGLTDENPWVVELSVAGRSSETHLVLAVLHCDDTVTKYFIWAVPTRRLLYEEDPE